jgi:hypothetical protein
LGPRGGGGVFADFGDETLPLNTVV